MRVRRRLATAGLFGAVGATILVPGPASAAPTITLSPPVVTPGGTVEVRADCPEGTGQAAVGRSGEQATASTVLQKQPTGTGVWGSLTIPSYAPPGQYTVAVLCGSAGAQGTAALTVAPPGPAATGGGGTADHGWRTPLLIGGGVLLGVAALGGALQVRRRRSGG